jgi:biotin operon repressor
MRYKSTTGFSRRQFAHLAQLVSDELLSRGFCELWFKLSFAKQLEVTLVALRNNVAHELIADMYGVSQPTIWRAVERVKKTLGAVLDVNPSDIGAVRPGRVLLIDGTVIPTGNRPGQGRDVEKENYSGKHRVQGLNVQIAADTDGTLLAVSQPVPGRRHDSAAFTLTGWAEQIKGRDWIADTAYTSFGAITPHKKKRGEPRSEADKIYNRSVSSIRAAVEHAVRRLKEWKIMATGYRSRLSDLPKTITLITQLEIYRQATTD